MKRMILMSAFAVAFAASTFAQTGGGCVGIAVGSEQKDHGKFAASFSATQVADIDLSVLFTPGSAKRFGAGNHVIEVRVFTPGGNLYESISVPVTTDSSRAGQKQKVDGYPRAMAVQLLRSVSGNNGQQNLAASVRLPVGGTMISTNGLYGQWTAKAFVDGEPLSCSQTASFAITQ